MSEPSSPTHAPSAGLNRDQWQAVEEAVRQLEEAWHTEAEPQLEPLLTGLDTAIHERALIELVKVDLEYHWRQNRARRIETYLDQWPELRNTPATVLELLEAECLTSALFATIPSEVELQERFGDLAKQVDLVDILTQAEPDRRSVAELPNKTSAQSGNRDSSNGGDAAGSLPIFLPLINGQRFGRYEIRGQLGDGGEGNVYRAFDHHVRREVALKFPRYADPKVLERFVREPQAAAAVDHRNICRVYDAGQVGGVHYIAMALIEGETVQQKIESGGYFDINQAVANSQKVAGALAKVHQAGIIHRVVMKGLRPRG